MKRDDLLKLVEQSTVGLKDDPELRLDVRRELRSHVETAVEEHRAAGKTEEQSLTLAAKEFGSPTEIATDLLSANRGRMKLRALARLGIRALLIHT